MINDHENLLAPSRKDDFLHFAVFAILNIIPQIHMLIVCLLLSRPGPLVQLPVPQ